MKKVKFHLIAFAFILGIASAFATKVSTMDTAWFYLNSQGEPVTRIEGQPQCSPGSADCAQLFTIDGEGEPVESIGDPVEGALHQ